MVTVEQGDLFWVNFSPSRGSEPRGSRPAVIVQGDAFNRSQINTVVVAAITSNLKYENVPGNVRLKKGEGGIPKASVINVSQVKTVDRGHLGQKLGRLSQKKVKLLKEGLRLFFEL